VAPSVKVRLEVEGAPEAVAAFRAFQNQTKGIGKEAAAGFTGMSSSLSGLASSLSGVTRLFAAYQLTRLVVETAQFTASTVRLAAEQKDLALSLGTTISNFSALAAVAKATNTEQSKVVTGLGFMADRIKDLREGAPQAVKAFAQLGLSAKDFTSDDAVVNAVKVGEALERVARGGTRGALATETLGKAGRSLLPVFERLNEIGGLEGATRFAERLGVLVDSKTAATFDAIASEMGSMELFARGLALEFAKAFGPGVIAALQTIQKLFGDAKPAAQALGVVMGTLARVIAVMVIDVVALGTALADIATLRFDKLAGDFERFNAMIEELGKDPEIRPTDDSVGAPSPPGTVAVQRLALEKKYADLNERLFDETDRARQADLQRQYQAELISLEEFYAQREKIIEEAFKREQEVKLKLAASLPEGSLEQNIAIREAAIIDQQRVAAVQELKNQLEAAREPARKFADDLRRGLTQALTDFVVNGINQVHSLTDAFRQLGLTVANMVQQVAGSWLVRELTSHLPGFASGGLVSGPGTGTSDSIPAWVSSGEYIVRAGAVARPGMFPLLDAINRDDAAALGAAMRANMAVRGIRPSYFAEGGLVGDVQRSPMAAGAGSSSVNGQIGISLDDGLILRAIESPAGQRVLLKVMSKSPRAFGNAIRR
jgi:hypothetical protein